MAKDSKQLGKRIGAKGAGTGAMTEVDHDLVGENDVLSNRDKTQHSAERGLDSRSVQTDQLRDHVANRDPEE